MQTGGGDSKGADLELDVYGGQRYDRVHDGEGKGCLAGGVCPQTRLRQLLGWFGERLRAVPWIGVSAWAAMGIVYVLLRIQAKPVADFIAARSDPTDRVFVFGSEAEILFQARRKGASRFALKYPLTVPWSRYRQDTSTP